jgi:hypothetical protein
MHWKESTRFSNCSWLSYKHLQHQWWHWRSHNWKHERCKICCSMATLVSSNIQVQVCLWSSCSRTSSKTRRINVKVFLICWYKTILCFCHTCGMWCWKRTSSLQNWPFRLISWLCSSCYRIKRAGSSHLTRKAVQEEWRKVERKRGDWGCYKSAASSRK